MSSSTDGPSRVLAVYPLAELAMLHAAQHDEAALAVSLAEIVACLNAVRGDSVAGPLAALDEAWTARDWPSISTRIYQLTCALPYGFPADPSRLPPLAEDRALTWTPCSTHVGQPPAFCFCPSCGAPAWSVSGASE